MPRDHNYYVYILASQSQGTLYIGVTNDLRNRVQQHRDGLGGVFTRRYRVHLLVWFEHCGDITSAIQREKSLKRWPRDWKRNLIERDNPRWEDLFASITSGA